ncbi:DUF5753 domain-containing protein [Streptomyces sp. TRM68367]|uniref:DUF5753 domain-containing protein n=1 Tax=Streptomyces sp. TRM68367 TaxID=2758415 RepID=UPI00165C3B0E|nr:DUF5753 domain-containing protein [Streptomyces sp. TRM68367]MBC9726941.1 hypothetical protein [Streptomyces sp. TRM68367]
MLDLAELEDGSRELVCYEPMFIPGLLQTEEYATAGYRGGYTGASRVEQDREVEFRIRRQAVLTGENAPRLHAVIHEAALHMSFGDPEIRRGQLVRLLEAAELRTHRGSFSAFCTHCSREGEHVATGVAEVDVQ